MAGGNIPANLKPLFVAAGKQYGIPANVLAGVASVETNLGANRGTSSAGAVGLMQFEPSTARSIGINPYNDRQAIFGAAKLLVQMGYHSNPLRALGAYNGGPGNPQYSYANLVMSEAKRLSGQLSGVGPASAKAIAQQQSGATPGSPALTSQIPLGGIPNAQAAIRAAVQKQLWKPINTSGKVDLSSANGFLNQINNNIDSGQFNTPLVTKTLTAPGTPARGGQASPQLATPTNGHVNPFPGAVGSRLDQGMDMTIKNALAPFDGKVIYASASDPGWKGGGFIAIRDAHDPSRIIYIAEGIAPTVRTGQTVRAGQLVAKARSNPYNGIVGNIEAGWAAGNGRQPLAQTVTNRPQAALSFYKWFRSLGGPSATSTSNAGYP